jgi:hypothetical protein
MRDGAPRGLRAYGLWLAGVAGAFSVSSIGEALYTMPQAARALR